MASGGVLVDMGTDFDSFSPMANAYATDGVDSRQQANRAVLRNAMAKGGLAPLHGRMVAFRRARRRTTRPILDVPMT